MSLDMECANRNFFFVFSSNTSTFRNAQQECRNLGGSLAVNLDEDDYSLLSSCRHSKVEYWIGLLNRPRVCRYRNEEDQYQWVNSSACSSARPLVIQPQPNNRRCQAVKIAFPTVEQKLPLAYETACDSWFRYICQIPKSKIEQKPSTRVQKSFTPPSFGAATTPNSSLKISSPTLNVAALVGGVLGLVCLILLLAVIYQCFCKTKRSKETSKPVDHQCVVSSVNKSTSLPMRSPSQKSCHIYCTISEDYEKATEPMKLGQGRKARCKSQGYVSSQLQSQEGYQTVMRASTVHLDCYFPLSTSTKSNYEAYVRAYEPIDDNETRSPYTTLTKNSSYVQHVRPL